MKVKTEHLGIDPRLPHLTVPLQLVPQPLEVAVASPHTGLLHLEDGQIGLESKGSWLAL